METLQIHYGREIHFVNLTEIQYVSVDYSESDSLIHPEEDVPRLSIFITGRNEPLQFEGVIADEINDFFKRRFNGTVIGASAEPEEEDDGPRIFPGGYSPSL